MDRSREEEINRLAGWYILVKGLANNNILEVEKVLNLPLYEVLDYLVICKFSNELDTIRMKR